MSKYVVLLEQDDDLYESRNTLTIEHPDHHAEYYDYGEPEDNSFFRDWSWVISELEKAYKLGYNDGKDASA